MLHIILFLLKLIGIILLSILGIILFLILIVLFVPVRYRMEAEWNDEFLAKAKIGWLFRALYVRITFTGGKLRMILRIFGRVFYDSDKPKEKIKKDIKRGAAKIGRKAAGQAEELVEPEKGGLTKPQPKSRTDTDTGKSAEKQDVNQTAQPEINQEAAGKAKDGQSIGKTDVFTERSRREKSREPDGGRVFDKASKEEDGKTGRVKRFFQGIVAGLKSFYHKIKNFFLKIKSIFSDINDKVTRIRAVWHKCREFLDEKSNRAGLKHIYNSLRKSLRHIRPGTVRAEIEFGTGDPCMTGQALGAAAVFIACYGKAVQITPDFENEIWKGTLFLKGRIRLFTLLIICIKLILDKNFRHLVKNFRDLKEEL